MTDTYSNQQYSSKSKRLFLLFLSPEPFSSNPIRSLLIYFEEHSFFPLIKYSSNLYTASSSLALDYYPLVYQWRLPDGRVEKVTISIIPNGNTYLLCWNLGSFDVAEYLIGSKTNLDIISGLKEMLRGGSYMSNSQVAALTYESIPNQDVRLSIVDYINFSLAKLPIILSSRFCLSPSFTCVADKDLALFSTEENPVFIPRPLPYESLELEPDFSIWSDLKNDKYYRLPNSLILSVADFFIYNCLSSLNKRVDRKELEKYALTVEEANNYLVPEFEQSLQLVVDYVNDFITDRATTANVERTKKLDRTISKADWTQIICECLSVTSWQIQHNPELVEKRIKKLLLQFQNLIKNNQSVDRSARDSAKATVVKIQNVLNSHGFELGDSVEQFVDLFEQFSSIGDRTNDRSEENIRLEQAISFFAEIDLAQNNLETIVEQIANRYRELWGNRDSEIDLTDSQAEYTKSARKIVREVTEQHPLPNFSFDDLL